MKYRPDSLTVVLLAIAGVVLVYAAIKGKDPRDLIKDALKKGQ